MRQENLPIDAEILRQIKRQHGRRFATKVFGKMCQRATTPEAKQLVEECASILTEADMWPLFDEYMLNKYYPKQNWPRYMDGRAIFAREFGNHYKWINVELVATTKEPAVQRFVGKKAMAV